MMQVVWQEAAMIGSGTDADPFRPDVGDAAIGWATGASDGKTAIVYVVYPDDVSRSGKGVIHSETRVDGARTVSAEARTAITSRTAALKLEAFEPEHVYITPRDDTSRAETARDRKAVR